MRYAPPGRDRLINAALHERLTDLALKTKES
jgi:hypothetical protein